MAPGAARDAPSVDLLPAFCFRVDIPGCDVVGTTALFRSASGLRSETEVIAYHQGGVNWTSNQLVGATRFSNLVLKRGFTGPPFALVRWREQWVRQGKGRVVQRHDGRVSQLDSTLQVVCSWQFRRGWPCRWEGPELDASKSELAIETLEIAHEGLVLEVPTRQGGG